VTKDLGYARIYFTVMGNKENIHESEAGLASAAGFLRHELSRRLKMRVVPELHFIYDDTQEKAYRLSSLIDQGLAKGRREDNLENNS
jgi:ribosome-binding factor A